MTVPSFLFVGFAVLVALLVNVSANRTWRSATMLVANLGFMASFAASPLAALPFAGFLGFGFIAVRLLQAGRRLLTAVSVVTVLLLFFWLKRYDFVPQGLWLPGPYVTIGLSYVFFRVLHLVIDAGQGVLTDRLGPVDYVNYTLNFPCIVAGPIQMYPDWKKGDTGRPDLPAIAWAGERIIIGLFKVLLVSALLDSLHQGAIARVLAAAPGGAALADTVLVIAIYPLYLYANFSGYTDVVIGAARLAGLRLPENFDRPFSAASFIDFWNRWHITLSTWLRTYVYSPLLMALLRRFPAPGLASWLTVVCFFVTFFLVGAWHGQSSEFLFFGVLQGGGVAANKLFQLQMADRLGRKPYRALAARPLYVALARGLTFAFFAFSLMWFWGDWAQLAALATAAGPGGIALALLVILAAATIILDAMARARALIVDGAANRLPAARRLDWRAAVCGVLLLFIGVNKLLLDAAPPPIVYKDF